MKLILLSLFSLTLSAQDWSQEAMLPGNEQCFDFHGHHVCLRDGDRANIYNLTPAEFIDTLKKGAEHAVVYPVKSTGLKLPYEPVRRFFESEARSPIRRFFYDLTKEASPFQSFDDMFKWMGLNNYPESDQSALSPNYIPKHMAFNDFPMGVTVLNNTEDEDSVKYLTFSCAACHSADLFGVKVLGMTNRFPRANDIFITGKRALRLIPAPAFRAGTAAGREDTQIFKKSRKEIRYVGLKKPITLGLDTSLAQVGLSLALREEDDYATKTRKSLRNPRPNELNHVPADSKPAVWWNLKYKTRWLSDGSIISGNPVHTNFLWNEIGRAVDLKELEQWLLTNIKTIKELTSYVFSTQAPRYNDFFPGRIDQAMAMRGERHYLNNCKGCHGIYEKLWDTDPNHPDATKTTKVWYHRQTPVIPVGTDPYRYEGMRYFAKDLNRLAISKSIDTIVEPQLGYVPPPLVGIWARYPYFHNNSAPSLWDVLTPEDQRPTFYIQVPAEDGELDFDHARMGYPQPEHIRAPYKSDPLYKVSHDIKGLSNQGHTKNILLNADGTEKLSLIEKIELIEFLKTL